MKTLLITLSAVGCLGANGYAQGTLTFSAGPGEIQFTTDGITTSPVPVGSPAVIPGFGLGELNITAFTAAQGTVLTEFGGVPFFTGAWTPALTVLHNINLTPGLVAGTTITMNAAQNTVVEVEIVAWAGTATTWSQALGDGDLIARSGGRLSGGVLGYVVTLGGPTIPGTDPTGPTGFNSLVIGEDLPEPSTMALGGLGATALLLFRRRK